MTKLEGIELYKKEDRVFHTDNGQHDLSLIPPLVVQIGSFTLTMGSMTYP